MVVDDEPAVSRLLSELLERRGFRVVVVNDPRRAASRARSLRPHLIALDVAMPGIDGLELLGVLRHDPETSGTPVLVVSGTSTARAARLGGAVGFVPKPVDPILFYRRVDEALAAAQETGPVRKLVLGGRATFRRRSRRIFQGAGFQLLEAETQEQVLEAAEEGPLAAVLDLELPPEGAVAVCEALRRLPVVGDLPVIVAGGGPGVEDRVAAFATGCDDVVPAPLYPEELLARVQRRVARRLELLDANPSSGLPGGVAIEREIARRVAVGQAFVFCYADVDHFKVFNDVYGYAKADGVIRHLASLMLDGGRRHGVFVGHVGGDDFVVLGEASRFQAFGEELTEAFDRLIALHYDPADLAAGHVTAPDRYGTLRRFPLLSLSLAALRVTRPAAASLFGLSAAAAEAKRKVKRLAGSNVLLVPAPGEAVADREGDLARARAEIEQNPALVREARRRAVALDPAGGPVGSLAQALLRLGYKEVRRLLAEHDARRTP